MVSSRLGGGVSPRGASSSPTPKKWNPPTCWVISLSSSGWGRGSGRAGWGPMVSSITLSFSSSLSSASGTRVCFFRGLRPAWAAGLGRGGGAALFCGAAAISGCGAGSLGGAGGVSGGGAGSLDGAGRGAGAGGTGPAGRSGSGPSSRMGSGSAGSGAAGAAGSRTMASGAAGAGGSGCGGAAGGWAAGSAPSPSSSRVRSSREGRAASSRLPSAFSWPGRSSMISPVGAMGVCAQKISSSSWSSGGGAPRAFSSLPKNRASRPCLRSGWRVGLIISSGTWATLVVKKVSNFFFSISSRVKSRRSASLGIHMSLPTRGSTRPGLIYTVPARWAWIS